MISREVNVFKHAMIAMIGLLVAGLSLTTPAYAVETQAKAAILLDARTGQILFEKNADEPLPPASMSKLMTVFLLFERLKEGTLSLQDDFPVSEKAWRMGGSKMFVKVGERVRIEDLIRGIVIHSGNDACIVVAEGIAGSESAFAEQMTRRGREIGLTNSQFRNASGWPEEGHVMSVRDLSTLAYRIISTFPEYYGYFSQKSFEFNDIEQSTRNPLLNRGVPGVDGMKTGHTNEAGYGMVASAERDGRRLILVLAGLETAGSRANEAERLLEYGYRHFLSYPLFEAGEEIEQARVWMGDASTVPLVAKSDVHIALTREQRSSLDVRVSYAQPIEGPINEGDQIASLIIGVDGEKDVRVPLYAANDVEAANLFGRVSTALKYLIWGGS